MERQALTFDYQYKLFLGRLFTIFIYIYSLSFSGISVAGAGSEWLAAQSTPAGSYANNLVDLATDFQSTAEATHSLHLLEVLSATELQNSSAYLHANTVKNTENLSRLILNNTLTGLDIKPLVSDILNHSNPDGGFAELTGFESTALDTAFALHALAISGNKSSQTIDKAITYLLNSQNPDGGYSLSDSNESNVYVTSLCVSALQQYIFQYNLSEVLSSAVESLFAQQLNSGGWGTHWETALALSAIAPITTDISRYANAVNVLKAGQSAEGSWSESIYTTALALRVLHEIENIALPTDITTAALTGRIVSATSGLSLQGGTVTIEGIESIFIAADSVGRFSTVNLPAPQNYTVTYNAPGYQDATQNISLVEGQQMYLGTIPLNPLPDIGLFTGIITDVETGQPISHASLNVYTESLNITATTSTDGSYFIAVNPGAISIAVTATGYKDVNASGTIPLAGTLNFSPALYSEGSINPGIGVTLRGSVIDTDTLLQLEGAKVSVAGSTVSEVLSNTTGEFVLSTVVTGEIQLAVQLPDYQVTELNLLVAAGGDFELGNIHLRSLAESETSMRGTVIDSTTGNAIAGASVQVGTFNTTSDMDGNFLISGIAAMDLSVSVSAAGYLTYAAQLVLQEPGPVQINIPLQSAVRGGVEIVSVIADQTEYEAYSLVIINSLVQNGDSFSKDIQLLGEIIDSTEQVIHRFPLSNNHAERELGDAVSVASNTSIAFEGLWSIEETIAGDYRINIKAFDANNDQLLAEKETQFSINETQKISQLQIKVSPGYTNYNETEEVELTGVFLNLSNSHVETEYNYSVLDPDGEIINSGVISLEITPDEKQKSIVIDHFLHTFNKSGIYTLELQYQAGTVSGQILTDSISVAPTVRVELNQSIMPPNIIPDGDKRISIGVEIKGVQQQ